MDATRRISDALAQVCIDEENRNPWVRGEWQCFNDGSVEVEVGEFLYGLVRLLKPRHVLETGTYYGVSAAYIGLAMKQNKMGALLTLDINRALCDKTKKLTDVLGIKEYVIVLNQDVRDFEPFEPMVGELDLLFLDSEPDLRFNEFDRFYDYVAPGGFILIHDLHWHLGLTWYVNNGMVHWPYGDFRGHKVGEKILSHELQVIPFFTPRGLVLFQKAHPEFLHPRYLAGTLEEKEPWS